MLELEHSATVQDQSPNSTDPPRSPYSSSSSEKKMVDACTADGSQSILILLVESSCAHG